MGACSSVDLCRPKGDSVHEEGEGRRWERTFEASEVSLIFSVCKGLWYLDDRVWVKMLVRWEWPFPGSCIPRHIWYASHHEQLISVPKKYSDKTKAQENNLKIYVIILNQTRTQFQVWQPDIFTELAKVAVTDNIAKHKHNKCNFHCVLGFLKALSA